MEEWETGLWDGYPLLTSHVEQSIGWLAKFGRITSGLQRLNKDYGKGLSKLVKKENSKSQDGRSIGSAHKAILEELNSLAARHKEVSVGLGEAARETQDLVRTFGEQHREVEAEARKLKAELEVSVNQLERCKEKFWRRQQEADRTEDTLAKAEPDQKVSRGELEKLKEAADEKRDRACKAREDYILQLKLTNSYQRGYYRETWPKIMTKLAKLSKQAGEGVANQLEQLGEKGEDAWPSGEEAWGELANIQEKLDIAGDFSNFLVWSKSGNPQPSEHKFAESPTTPMSSFSPSSKLGTLKRTMSRSSLRYRTCTTPVHQGSRFPSMFNLRSSGSVRSQRKAKSFKASKEREVELMKESDKSVTPVSISPIDGSEDDVPRESFIQNDTLEEEGEELNEIGEEFKVKEEELNENGEELNENEEELNENGEELKEKGEEFNVKETELYENGEELNEKGEEFKENGENLPENQKSIVSEDYIILPEEVHERENPFKERELLQTELEEERSEETDKKETEMEKTKLTTENGVGLPVHSYDDRKNPFMD